MPIRFRCSHCDKLLAVGTRMAGATLRCPICNNPLTAPDPQKAPREPSANPITILPLGGDTDAAWWIDSPLLPPLVSPPSTEPTGVPADAPRAEPAAWWVSGEPPLPPPPEPPAKKPEPESAAPTEQGASASPPQEPQRPYPLLTWALQSRRRLVGLAVVAVGLMLLAGLLTGLLLKRRPAPPRPQPPPENLSQVPEPEPAPAPKKLTRPSALGSRNRLDTASRPRPQQEPAPLKPKQEPVTPPAPNPSRTPPVSEEGPPLPRRVAALTPPSRPLVTKRNRQTSEDELRRQAEKAPEIGFNRSGERSDDRRMVQLAQIALAEGRQVEVAPMLMRQRVDLAGLPLRMGERSHCDPVTAERLEAGSLALRAHLFEAIQAAAGPGRAPLANTRPDAKKLRDSLRAGGKEQNRWLRPEAIPALLQLLMAEDEALRSLLVDQLAYIEGPRASVALAQRALFDFSAEVRRQALEALSKRPAEEYQQVLLDGFRYPWPVVADHAAEAVVALQMRDTVPTLLRLLDLPDPQAPFTRSGKEGHFIREMVRVNHLLNCLMCHAPSFNPSDRVRGFIPPTDQPLTLGRDSSQRRLPGQLVRADITYLQQDFSVPLIVKNPGKWPDRQPYDFLVRERPALVADLEAHRPTTPATPSDHQKAVFFALRELTGADPGPTVESWKRLFLGGVEISRLSKTVAAPAGVAVDAGGRLLVSSPRDRQLLRETEDGDFLPLPTSEAGKKLLATPCQGLALDSMGRLCACATEAGRILVLDLNRREVRVLAEAYRGKPLHGPIHLAADRKGGLYFSDDAGTKERGAVYHVSAQGALTQLPLTVSRPRGLALSPDGKSLYVVSDSSQAVMVYSLDNGGLPGPGHVLCKLEGKKNSPVGAEGMAVDGQGNLYVACTTLRAVQVYSSQGASLGLISLPQAPAYCTVVGDQRKTLYVSTSGGLFRVQVQTQAVKLSGQTP